MKPVPTILLLSLLLPTLACGKKKQPTPAPKPALPVQLVQQLDLSKTKLLEPIINTVKQALNQYMAEEGSYPARLEDLVPRFIRSAGELQDPWGTPLKLETDANQMPTLVSAGSDRQFGSKDDIRRK